MTPAGTGELHPAGFVGIRLRLYIWFVIAAAIACTAFIGFRVVLDLAGGVFTAWDLFAVSLIMLAPPVFAFCVWFIWSEHRVGVAGGAYDYEMVDRRRFDAAGLNALRTIDRCLKRPRRDTGRRDQFSASADRARRLGRPGRARAPRPQPRTCAAASRDGPRRDDDPEPLARRGRL